MENLVLVPQRKKVPFGFVDKSRAVDAFVQKNEFGKSRDVNV